MRFCAALLTLTGGVLQIAFSSLFLHLLPELACGLCGTCPGMGGGRRSTFDAAIGWHRVLAEDSKGFPRALPRLRASPSVMFALRMALTVALGTELYRWRGVPSGYWIPMTALVVQKPLFAETLHRSLLRVAGTLCGAVLGTFFPGAYPSGPDDAGLGGDVLLLLRVHDGVG